MRKFLAVLSLIICACFFGGCSTVSYYAVVEPNGSIREILRIEVDKTELASLGITMQTVFDMIRDKFSEFHLGKYNDFSIFEVEYIPTENINDGIIQLELKFNGYISYASFWGIDSNDSFEPVYEPGLFITKRILYRGPSDFGASDSASDQTGSLINEFVSFIEANKNLTGVLNLNKVKFNYIQGSLNGKMHSNADRITYQDGIYLHIWNMDLSERNREIMLFENIVTGQNRTAWYLTAITLTVIVMGTITITYLIKNKKKKAAY